MYSGELSSRPRNSKPRILFLFVRAVPLIRPCRPPPSWLLILQLILHPSLLVPDSTPLPPGIIIQSDPDLVTPWGERARVWSLNWGKIMSISYIGGKLSCH
eukprot:sb/3478490/